MPCLALICRTDEEVLLDSSDKFFAQTAPAIMLAVAPLTCISVANESTKTIQHHIADLVPNSADSCFVQRGLRAAAAAAVPSASARAPLLPYSANQLLLLPLLARRCNSIPVCTPEKEAVRGYHSIADWPYMFCSSTRSCFDVAMALAICRRRFA